MKKIFTILTMAVVAMGMVSCGNSHEKTIANLKTAIDGETAASAKYAAFADQAEKEGRPEIAALFRATSQAEGVHIQNHQNVLKALGAESYTAAAPEFKVDSTLANLKVAMEGEQYESKEMYPGFLADAELEKVADAATSFTYAENAEANHAILYSEAIDNFPIPGAQAAAYFICPICGNVYAGNASEICEICGTPQDKFIAVHAVVALELVPAEGDAPVAELPAEATATK